MTFPLGWLERNEFETTNDFVEPGWQLAYKADPPVLDGLIGPDEYGPTASILFQADNNPGRLASGTVDDERDLRLQLYAAYTASDLHLAFRVVDDFVDDQEEDALNPYHNDSVEIYIDGDGRPGDLEPKATDGHREGFFLIVDAAGHKMTGCVDFDNERWSARARRMAAGYIIETRIPLASMDTKDGPGHVPAGPGSTLGFNLIVSDSDGPVEGRSRDAVLWHESGSAHPFLAGEAAWPVKIRLKDRVRYDLVSGPSGATLDPDSGVFRWEAPAGAFREEATIRISNAHHPERAETRVATLEADGPATPTVQLGRSDGRSPMILGIAPPILVLAGLPTIEGEGRTDPAPERPPAAGPK